ncbi:MAG TPA: HAD family hydrolase [Polyangiaceae bacterium]|jgi:phosphoglycolate phosphatase-like HAD superfamily hydrolase|nr:HAD family hydrolase [Polyangiaceae bacterium]
MYLVLFDIDGTLLRGQGVGSRAMERVGKRLLGPTFTLDGIEFGGALDPWIFREAASRTGRHDADTVHANFRDAYIGELALALDEQRPELIAGVAAALAELASDETVTLGLVTGNYARAVPLKLAAVGIDASQFVVTAFGDEGPTRPELVRLAVERWGARGAEPVPERVVVIGDTPRDVDCAKRNGCHSVAVATGWHTLEQLAATGADRVVADLTGLRELLRELWDEDVPTPRAPTRAPVP